MWNHFHDPDTDTVPSSGIPATNHHRLRFADALDLGIADPRALHVVRAEGRGTRLKVPNDWITVVLVLAGEPEANAGWGPWAIPARGVLTWSDGALSLSGSARTWWIAIAARAMAWRVPGNAVKPCFPSSRLMPWQGTPDHELTRIMVHMARDTSSPPGNSLFGALNEKLQEQQRHDVDNLLDRCSGRTLRHRQLVLTRLLRVRKIMESHVGDMPDLGTLSRLANYSPHHLIRAYRNVFGETPAQYARRLRMKQARELVLGTGMPISEIAVMLGFESQSSFCRLFKDTYGMTTGKARQLQSTQSNGLRGTGTTTADEALAA